MPYGAIFIQTTTPCLSTHFWKPGLLPTIAAVSRYYDGRIFQITLCSPTSVHALCVVVWRWGVFQGQPQHVRLGNKPQRGEDETQFRLTLSTWIKSSRESDARGFIVSMFKHDIIWKKRFPDEYNPQWSRNHNYIKAELGVHVISSKKTGSGDRLPGLA